MSSQCFRNRKERRKEGRRCCCWHSDSFSRSRERAQQLLVPSALLSLLRSKTQSQWLIIDPPDRRKVPKFHPKFCKFDLWSKERPDLHDNIETINVAVCSLAEFIFDPQVSLAYLFFHLRSKTFYVVRHVSLSSLSKASIVGFVLRGGRWADMCNSSVPDKFARTTVAFSSAFLQNGHQLY